MLLEAIYHRPGQSYCYSYDEHTIHIRLRAKKNDLHTVSVLYGDKYDWDHTASVTELYKLASDEWFDYWQAEVAPLHLRLRYAFQLTDNEQSIWYTEKGFVKDKPHNPLTFFDFPFLWANEVLQPPAWVKDAVFYQIFPDRFANGDPSNDPESVRPWEASSPGPHDFYGGDLQGVLERLDYMSELGINAIYFTPLFAAKTNHKYDTTDYMKVDPQFGNTELLKSVVKACHDRGIRVMLDAVFNHCGYWFAPFQDVLVHGERSRYRDWFHIQSFPLTCAPRPSYHCFAFESHMPKLNTVHTEVRQYLLDVAQYWIRECDIDGWRLDVANEVDHEFWREFRKACKSLKPDFYILGEIWHDAMPWLQGDQFDAVMNYPVTEAILDFYAKNLINAEQFASQVNKLLADYPQQVNEATFTILGSHDTPRLLTVTQDERKMKLAVLFQFSFLGAPCIYYGDEIGMTGGEDPDCRKPMIWDVSQQNRSLYSFYQQLITMRTSKRALQAGAYRIIYAKKQQLVVERKHDHEQVFICFNNSEEAITFTVAGLKIASELCMLLGNGAFKQENDQLIISLPAYGWSLLHN